VYGITLRTYTDHKANLGWTLLGSPFARWSIFSREITSAIGLLFGAGERSRRFLWHLNHEAVEALSPLYIRKWYGAVRGLKDPLSPFYPYSHNYSSKTTPTHYEKCRENEVLFLILLIISHPWHNNEINIAFNNIQIALEWYMSYAYSYDIDGDQLFQNFAIFHHIALYILFINTRDICLATPP